MSVPVDILVSEHKLILKAVALIKKETNKIQANNAVNPDFIVTIVDFFRTYADRFHHGKEEGILFRELAQKKLSQTNNRIMDELIKEHVFARQTVTALENAKSLYVSGEVAALKDVLNLLGTLVELYPVHIEKENNHFFYPVMAYFSDIEKEGMLKDFLSFNTDFTDKRYKQIINSLS